MVSEQVGADFIEREYTSEDFAPYKTHRFEVGGGHTIHVEEWGEPTGIPVMVLHGGPGAAFNDTHKAIFDKKKHRVILFDQRGCGQSTPPGKIENNSTQDLIGDINLIRERLGITGPMNIAGGSWGSSLALIYAIEHPENVKEMVLWSTALVRAGSYADMLKDRRGEPGFKYGKAWERFTKDIPDSEKVSGERILQFYIRMVLGEDQERALKFAIEFQLYEFTLCAPDNLDSVELERAVRSDPNTLPGTRVELSYVKNGFFVSGNYIIDNISEISDIKTTVVHGERDQCTPMQESQDLEKAYGPNMTLEVADSGHLRSDRDMKRRLRNATSRLT
jgi:proline iminopeptidase